MATEEFTFPIISNDTCPSSIDSPPLWRLSPAASPDPYRERRGKSYEEEEKGFYRPKPKAGNMQRKSCSDIANKDEDYDDEEEEEEEEEKMDVLWEDLNEELYRGKSTLEGYNNSKSSSSSDMVELGCVQALKLSPKASNNNGAMFSSSSSSPPRNGSNNNKPGVVVFIKVLKKLFLLHNSHHHQKQQQQHHHHHRHHHRHKSVTVRNLKW